MPISVGAFTCAWHTNSPGGAMRNFLFTLFLFTSAVAQAQPWICRITKSPDFGRWQGNRPVHTVKTYCRFAIESLLVHSSTILCTDEKIEGSEASGWILYIRTCVDQVARKAEIRYAIRVEDGPGRRIVGW